MARADAAEAYVQMKVLAMTLAVKRGWCVESRFQGVGVRHDSLNTLIYIHVNMLVSNYKQTMFLGVSDVLRVTETQACGNLMITFDVKSVYETFHRLQSPGQFIPCLWIL